MSIRSGFAMLGPTTSRIAIHDTTLMRTPLSRPVRQEASRRTARRILRNSQLLRRHLRVSFMPPLVVNNPCYILRSNFHIEMKRQQSPHRSGSWTIQRCIRGRGKLLLGSGQSQKARETSRPLFPRAASFSTVPSASEPTWGGSPQRQSSR